MNLSRQSSCRFSSVFAIALWPRILFRTTWTRKIMLHAICGRWLVEFFYITFVWGSCSLYSVHLSCYYFRLLPVQKISQLEECLSLAKLIRTCYKPCLTLVAFAVFMVEFLYIFVTLLSDTYDGYIHKYDDCLTFMNDLVIPHTEFYCHS